MRRSASARWPLPSRSRRALEEHPRCAGRARIEYVPRQRVVELDPRTKEARLESGGTVCTTSSIPVHRVPAAVESSDSPLMVVPVTTRTSRRDFRTYTRWAMFPLPMAGPVCSPRPRPRSWPTTSPHVCAAGSFSALRGRRQLLHRVRRRDGRQGRGQLPRRSGSDSTARRPLSRTLPGTRKRSPRRDVRAGLEPDLDARARPVRGATVLVECSGGRERRE